jgi:hypothetical protein
VTKGSSGVAAATLPNICKMPGPPAPFVPTPLPNIGKSGNSPDGYSTTVTIDGDAVAIQGASFLSMGDVASKGTGGGMVSMNVEGPTKFVGPGSMDVKIEGKNVQLLSDQMLNNCGPSGSPANSATMGGLLQAAKAKNPARLDICGPGKHTEEIDRPKVPPGEETPAGRVAAMKSVASTPGDAFEIAAAEHNIADKSITSGDQLSRDISPAEKAAGADDGDQAIWAVCTVCGYRREVDQSPNDKSTVESKSSAKAVKKNVAQKANNKAMVAAGGTVTYKAPPLHPDTVEALENNGFKYIPIE